MSEDQGTARGGELSHGYVGGKSNKATLKTSTTSMDAQTETNGYRPSISQAKPASRPVPPKPPAGDAGGSR